MIKFDYSGLTGEVITKENFSYEEDRKAWNRSIEKYPLVIVFCNNKNDIINAITWAKINLLEIRIRAGRHHYEGYSTGNDVVVIDVSKMNGISVDEEKELVTIQGGVTNRELYDVLGKQGYPFPGGGCPSVGVTGFVLGGGWGYSVRLLGLAADRLVQVEMIDYNGKIIVATEKSNEDLFWACKGSGGGNFGVIISMTFKIPEKIIMATLINIEYIEAEPQEIIKVFEIWTSIFKDLDRRINLKMSIYNSSVKGNGVKISGLFYGNKEEANVILALFKNISKKGIFDLDYITVLEANRSIQDSHPLFEKYKSSGRFVYREYTKHDMENIINLVKYREEGSTYAAVSLYGLGGAVGDKGVTDSAFYYRNAKFIIGFQSVWEDSRYAPANREWVKNKLKYIYKITTGSYINFPCAELEDYEKEYYGENLNKLKEIKRKYDPFDIFKFPQGIKID